MTDKLIGNGGNLSSGIVSLKSAYNLIKENPDPPHRKNDIILYSAYRKIIRSAIDQIPYEAGWYAWIAPNPKDIEKDEQNLVRYIGQSQKRKTSSLRARIEEELLEESVAFWATLHDEDKVLLSLNTKYKNKYNANHRRSIKKKGVKFIIWISGQNISDGELDIVEQKLINDYNPSANTDIRDYRNIKLDLYDNVKRELELHLSDFNPDDLI